MIANSLPRSVPAAVGATRSASTCVPLLVMDIPLDVPAVFQFDPDHPQATFTVGPFWHYVSSAFLASASVIISVMGAIGEATKPWRS